MMNPLTTTTTTTTNNHENNSNNNNIIEIHENNNHHEASSSSLDCAVLAERVQEQEQHHHRLWLLVWNNYAAFVVFGQRLITLECIVSVLLSVSLTLVLYYYYHDTANNKINGSALNWVLLSFAVITPLAASVNMAFGRRETALRSIGTIRATLLELYVAHAVWDWGTIAGGGGRPVIYQTFPQFFDPTQHAHGVYETILTLQDNLCRFLTLPNSSRARHRTTQHGREEAQQIDQLAAIYHDRVLEQVVQLAMGCEALKRAGLPGNEAARIRSWEHIVLVEIEQLRNLKRYRTPQGLRSFGRLFSIFLPPFYAPYYTDLARQLHSLPMGIAFAILTAVALTSLFETVAALEDPFVLQHEHRRGNKRQPPPSQQQQQSQPPPSQQQPSPQQRRPYTNDHHNNNDGLLDGINVHEELITSFTASMAARRRQLLGVRG